MKIKAFIQNEVLLPRLKERGILIVYDPERRYHELCVKLSTPSRRVIDCSASSIESREQALASLQELGQPNCKLEGLLVYVPGKPPVTDEQKQHDPFAIYGACGAIFPFGDGDEYQSLCLKARPDFTPDIRRIFHEDPNPAFAVIDAVGCGTGWPNLQAVLKVESARDILLALLAPTEWQISDLKKQEAWVSEAKDLFARALGLKLLTRGKTYTSVAEEVWRFVLFSEFAFHLPAKLPDALANVPRAAAEMRPLIEDICDQMRNDRRTQSRYIEKAESIEKELNLEEVCVPITGSGTRVTFPFEERAIFALAVDALKRDNNDQVRQIVQRHRESVWVGRGENHAQWLLLESAVSLIAGCEDAERQLPDHISNQAALIDFYLGSLRETDRLQREFEQAATDPGVVHDEMAEVLSRARKCYRKLTRNVQDLFIKHLEKSGWPPPGRQANAEVFDHWIAPKLQECGRRVAFLLIDALRYELGLELEKQLCEDGQVEIHAAFAQLPSITPVGMASLLPEAAQKLQLTKTNGELVPALGETLLTNVTQRMELLRKRYGQRFHETPLAEFLRAKADVPKTVELLVIRSNTMDSLLESESEATLRLISDTLKRIRVVIHKLVGMGFKDVVIATDHGFYLNTGTEAGDVCGKPPGNWLTLHERCLMGNGTADGSNFVLPAAHLGIRGDFNQVAGPRGMVAYSKGIVYFHGGASLQEAIVPVISMRLQAAAEKDMAPKVELSYKEKARKITTRLPVIKIVLVGADLFSYESGVEILLEAHDKKGNVVGEARPGGAVNPATGTISLKNAQMEQVALKMEPDFEGKFTVKALNPTTLSVYDKLDLETDYTV